MTDQELTNFLRNLEKSIISALKVRSDTPDDGSRSAKKSLGAAPADFSNLNKKSEEVAENLDKLQTAANVARGELFNLGADAKSTAGNISGLNSMVQSITASMATLKLEGLGGDSAAVSISALTDKSGLVGTAFGRLERTTLLLRKAFQGLLAETRSSRKGLNSTTVAATENAAAAGVSTEATKDNADANRKSSKDISASSSFLGGVLNRFGINLKDGGDKAEWLRSQLTNLGWALAEAAINVTRDLYHLQARGISAGDSLFELYGNAMKAGMSLQEYTSMLQENSAAVVRAGSFQEFGDSVDRTTRELNRLGVFGPAAEGLAASLRTSAVALGINREQQDAAISSQVKLFEQLRKTTLMTAEAFKELQADIANNQMVQEELLGLAPQERAARLQQITAGATIGYQLGATAQASKQLQEALLAQRRSTIEDRFRAAGMIRMGGAMMGMDTSRVEEYARLMLKNPALRTEEEKKRIAELSGDYQQFLQALKSSPNPALENIADKISQLTPAVQSELQAAAGTVKLQAEAGLAQNADIGKETSGFMQDIGRGLTALSGFMKNPLADAMVIFGSILAQTVIQSSLLAIIAKNTGGGAGVGMLDWLRGKKGGKGAAADKGPAVGKGPVRTGLLGKMFGLDVFDTLKFTAEGDLIPEQAKKGLAARFGEGLKATAGKIFGIFKTFGPVSVIFGAIEEAFTGEMAAGLGFGDDIGGRLLGIVVGGFNSFFTGITRMVDSGFNWVMEGLGLSIRSNMTKFFDAATLVLTIGAKTIASAFARVFSDIIGFFSKDAPWAKSLREFSDRQDAEVASQAETLKTLWNTEGTTLRSMGEQHIKAQKQTADKSKQLSQATANNVVMGVENLMSAVKTTAAAQTSQVRPGATPTTTIATPQPTPQPSVTTPEVNRAQVEQDKKTAATQSDQLTIAGMQELISNTQQQLDVLKQLLALNMSKQVGAEGKLAELLRPSFSDNVDTYGQIIAA